jgi:Tol biopolymer transport system component
VEGIGSEAEWVVVEGGGEIQGVEIAPGLLGATWILGPALGLQRIRVSVAGEVVEFDVTAVESSRIAFISDRASGSIQWDLFTMNPDGTDVVRVTSTNHRDKDPDWSPDHTRIVFTRVLEGEFDGGMRIVDAETGEETTVLGGNADGGAWSPDGSTIAFFTKGGAEGCDRAVHNLWLVDVDGSDARQITHDPCAQGNKWPEWSPDGTRIVYDSRKDSGGPNTWHVWIMDADASGAHRITEGNGEYAHWSPDGATIAYGEFGPNAALSVVQADGTGERTVWRPDMEGAKYVFPGGFSPDGTFVVVEVGLEGQGPVAEIFIVDIESGEESLQPP